ncbi:hypothetical protein MBLNU230_g6949t1 [Neophaeotheca triangularis]
MATTFRDNFKYLPQPAECLAILIGCAELSIFGLAGLANPSAFIQNYGLPAITAAPKTNSQILDAKSSQATKDADVRQAYIAAIAARNMQNGICLLAFACYWRDRRALGTVVASAVVTTFADWMIVRWYGVKEAEFGHVIGVVNSTAIGASLLYWVGEAWY